MLLSILSIIALLVIAWYFGSQKVMADAEEQVIAAWGALDRAYQQQENLAAAMLENTILSSEPTEHTKRAWQESVELLVNPSELKAPNVRRYQARKAHLSQTMEAWILTRKSRQNPHKPTGEKYAIRFQENEKTIRQAIDHYNAEVTRYNKLARRFPISLLHFSEKPLYPDN